MLELKQFIRLPHERHAIKEAAISLFFGSQFMHEGALRQVLEAEFADEFNQVRPMQDFAVQLVAPLDNPAAATVSQQPLGPPGMQATQVEEGVMVRMLQARNEPDRTTLTLHNLQYKRWADFLDLFQRLAEALAGQLTNMVVLAVGLHYIDELVWVHPTELMPVARIYRPNLHYLPQHFFDSPASELALTVPTSAANIPFFDRLHLSSTITPNQTATISHYLVHQFAPPHQDLSTLLAQPNRLTNVLAQAHDQNKNVLRAILQPEVLTLINLPHDRT